MNESGSTENRLDAVYLIEAVRLVEDIRTGIDQLEAYWARHKEFQKHTEENTLVVDPKIQKDLQAVISDLGRLYNLLTYKSRSKQCPYIDFSRKRTSYFRDLLGALRLDAIGSRAARNSLEHFEERVDEEILRQQDKHPNAAGLIHACIFSNTRMLDLVAGDRTRIRAFAFDEMHYFNFDGDISLRLARKEAEAIRFALINRLGKDNYENAAGGYGLIYPGAPPGAITPTTG